MAAAQNPVCKGAKAIHEVFSHCVKSLYLIGTKMKKFGVRIGGNRLTKFGKYAWLVRSIVCPKGLIEFTRLCHDQHAKEIVVSST
jgi:hypothetical protein